MIRGIRRFRTVAPASALIAALAALAIVPLGPAGRLSAQAKRLPIGPKTEAASVRPVDDRATLLRLEDGWAAALVRRDRAYFEQTLDSAFIYTEDNQLSTRAQVLHDLLNPADTVRAAHNEGMVVHLWGSTGVVTGLLAVSGRSGRAAYEHRYRFTDTWVKQPNGSWKIAAAQDYLIPRKK